MSHVSLQKKYEAVAVPKMSTAFGYRNTMAVPKVEKVVVNIGVGRIREEKQHEVIRRSLALITGQKAAPRTAKKAIAAFKTRKGLVVGYQTTLRGRRMWDFLERLVAIAIPRQRDFRGISEKSFDAGGNLTVGFKEHIVFPEMIGEDMPFIFGLEATIITTARRREEGVALLKFLGFPLSQEAVEENK